MIGAWETGSLTTYHYFIRPLIPEDLTLTTSIWRSSTRIVKLTPLIVVLQVWVTLEWRAGTVGRFGSVGSYAEGHNSSLGLARLSAPLIRKLHTPANYGNRNGLDDPESQVIDLDSLKTLEHLINFEFLYLSRAGVFP